MKLWALVSLFHGLLWVFVCLVTSGFSEVYTRRPPPIPITTHSVKPLTMLPRGHSLGYAHSRPGMAVVLAGLYLIP